MKLIEITQDSDASMKARLWHLMCLLRTRFDECRCKMTKLHYHDTVLYLRPCKAICLDHVTFP